MPQSPLYETDFYAWAQEQAALLRAGALQAADIENIAEEIESMGRGEKRELTSRLKVLLARLLKWRFQPGLRGASWRSTIRVQRHELTVHLAANPSLKPLVPDAVEEAYRIAVILAAGETGLAEATFPTECPWSCDRLMDDDFWPESH